MPKALHSLLLALLLLLPLAARAAGDADYFIAAKPNEQASLLQGWAAQPDPARLELLSSLQQGRLGPDDSRKLRLNNRLRGLVENALASHRLLSDDARVRLVAAQQLQKSAQPAQVAFLDRRFASEPDAAVHAALEIGRAHV